VSQFEIPAGFFSLASDPAIRHNGSMQNRSSKRPRDVNQLGKLIVDLATGQATEAPPADDGKNPAAVALGRLGGLKGGKARAKSLSKKKRSEIAKKAANARWRKKTGA